MEGNVFIKYSNHIRLIAFAIIVLGCASWEDVLKAKNEGVVEIYSVNEKTAWDISKTVCGWLVPGEIKERRTYDLILTEGGGGAFDYGAKIGIWIEPIDSNNTKITVVALRRMSTNINLTPNATDIHKRISQAVNIVKKGKPLPEKAPEFE